MRFLVIYVHTNTFMMSITPQAIQDLLDELEASKQARLRAWAVLQRLRALLCDLGNVTIDPASKKTFDLEGAKIERPRCSSRQKKVDSRFVW
jgi:hypothetical protein